MIKIDEPFNPKEQVMYHSNCLTCNDPTNAIFNIITTINKYEAMILGNQHILEEGEGHTVYITYSVIN